MKTLLNDAFDPGTYANHIPTNTIVKNDQIINAILLAGGLIVLVVVAYKIYELNVEPEPRVRKM